MRGAQVPDPDGDDPGGPARSPARGPRDPARAVPAPVRRPAPAPARGQDRPGCRWVRLHRVGYRERGQQHHEREGRGPDPAAGALRPF
ncbi:MAG: hypothetical protein M0C28_46165 [Candidatus Moduliflexus flocculans]|nr:hypothetical protein [Candidatus Moduliflexus flocculans]